MDIREEMKAWNKMYGEATNAIVKILEGLPVSVAEEALKAALGAIKANSVITPCNTDFTKLPRFGL